MRQPLDYLRAPTLFRLPRQNVAADLPIKPHQLPVNRQSSALLCCMDTTFKVSQPA